MRAAGEQAQALGGFFHHLRFGKDAAADGNDGVGAQHDGIVGKTGGAGLVLGVNCLLVGKALRQLARQLVLFRRLVDMRGHQMLRLDADLVEQRKAARRGGCQDEFRPACHEEGLLARLLPGRALATAANFYAYSETQVFCEPPATSGSRRSRTFCCSVSRSVR